MKQDILEFVRRNGLDVQFRQLPDHRVLADGGLYVHVPQIEAGMLTCKGQQVKISEGLRAVGVGVSRRRALEALVALINVHTPARIHWDDGSVLLKSPVMTREAKGMLRSALGGSASWPQDDNPMGPMEVMLESERELVKTLETLTSRERK